MHEKYTRIGEYTANLTDSTNIRHILIYVWRLHEWDHLVNYTRLCRCVLCVFVCVRLCVFVRMCVFPFLSPFFSLSFLSFFQNKVTCALTTQRILSVFAPYPCVTENWALWEKRSKKRFSCVTRPPNRLQKNAHMFGEVRHVRELAELRRNSANFGTLYGEPPFLAHITGTRCIEEKGTRYDLIYEWRITNLILFMVRRDLG